MIPKFRAYYAEKMWYVAKIDLWGDPEQTTCDLAPYLPKYDELFDIPLIETALMQSTGLKDENGVEIFEGDVVKVTDGESEEDSYISIVKNYSNEGYPAFDIEYPPTYHYDSNVLSAIMCNVFETIEVIGNVYEDGDLLNDSEDTKRN